MSIASLSARPSPPYDRVGAHIVTFEACSGFTHVIARWIARPPKAAFVTRLRAVRLLVQPARQLPDQSTTLWVDPSSTGIARRRGAPYWQEGTAAKPELATTSPARIVRSLEGPRPV